MLFVWTMQRSIYDAILNATNKKGILRKQEYIHLINILYSMGIDCELKLKTVVKDIEIVNINENYKELSVLSQEYNLNYKAIKNRFENRIIETTDGFLYKCEQKIAFISFECNSNN